MANILTADDRQQLSQKGINEAQIEKQLEQFKQGFPFLRLRGAAAVGAGIKVPSPSETETLVAAWESYKAEGHHITKFVPASGAASRMFKDMFEFRDGGHEAPATAFEKTYFENLRHFAFFNDLDAACQRLNGGKNIEALLQEGKYKAIVHAMLDADGLNYGQLPKGLLKFHAYADGNRTPLEEHLVEAALYATSNGQADVHFTVSTEHRILFEKLVQQVLPIYEKRFGIQYHVTFSEQKPSTDTLAATMDNEPFRTENGKLLFRPGGHGALIQNLSDLESDIVFVKNIDNVVPDRLKPSTTLWKQIIAGVLVNTQNTLFAYLRKLDEGSCGQAELSEMSRYLQNELCCEVPGIQDLTDDELIALLRRKFNRPIRVCGMVKNVGEPGGGPFLAFNADGSVSPQILESSQIDANNPAYLTMFKSGTHFNPVDLVCAIRDYKGQKFDLPRFVDPATGFISFKSKNGKELKALELPGLWNGAMSDWNTIFVEVPLDTFNPVKTVNDLLRQQHQS